MMIFIVATICGNFCVGASAHENPPGGGRWLFTPNSALYTLHRPVVGADVLAGIPPRHATSPYRFYWGCEEKETLFPASDYHWSDAKTQLGNSTFREAFCASLSGSTVMLIGDSVQGQMFRSLVQLTNATVFHLSPVNASMNVIAPAGYNALHEVRINASVQCNNELAWLLYRRDEWFVPSHIRPTPDVPVGGIKWFQPWEEDMVGVDVLVASTGTHRRETAKYAEELEMTFQLWNSTWSDRSRLFLRDTIPIFPCSGASTPLRRSEYHHLLDHFADYQHGGALPKTSQILEQNKIAKELCTKYNATFLEVSDLSGRRLDDHAPPHRRDDCLHFCLPGSPDIWNQLWLSLIVSA